MAKHVALAWTVLALALTGLAQAPQQGTNFIGTWKLTKMENVSAPNARPDTPQETVTVSATDIVVNAQHGETLTMTPIDGQPVPVSGGNSGETVTITRIDAHNARVALSDQDGTMSGQAQVSSDGATMTLDFKSMLPQGMPVELRLTYTRS